MGGGELRKKPKKKERESERPPPLFVYPKKVMA